MRRLRSRATTSRRRAPATCRPPSTRNDVGGGFGAKIRPYPEDYLVAAASKLLGRPVKWIESRSEGLTATTHGRGETFDVEVAARRDGTLLALRVTQYQDVGAYIGFF